MKWVWICIGFSLFLGVFLFSCDGKQDRGDIPVLDQAFHSIRHKESMLVSMDQAIEDDPDNASLYYRRARIYADYKSYREALADMDKALDHDGYNAGYLYYKAYLLKEAGYYAEALEYGRKASGQGDTSPDLYILLAELSYMLGDIRQADDYTIKASRLAPHNAETLYLGAEKNFRDGDTLAGIAKLRGAIERKPEYANSYASMAAIYINQRKDDSAQVYIVRGLRSAEDRAALFFYHGKSLERMGFQGAAMVAYESAVALDSAYLPALETLGVYYFSVGQEDKARSYLKRYVTRARRNKRVNLLLAEIAEKNGENAEAILYFEQVLRLDSSDMAVRSDLERLYERLRPIVKEPDSLEVVVKDSAPALKAPVSSPPEVKKSPVKQPAKKDSARPAPVVEPAVKEVPDPVQETPVQENRSPDSVRGGQETPVSNTDEDSDKNKKKKKNKKQQGEP